MEVSFYAMLRQVVGTKRVAFALAPDATVGDLLEAVGARFAALKPLMWEPDGRLSDYIKVFVDGREMRHMAGLQTPVPPTAQVDIFPPSAGG